MSATTPIPVADHRDPGQLTTWKRDVRKAAAATDAAEYAHPLTISLAERVRWLPLPSPTFRNAGRLLPNGYRRP